MNDRNEHPATPTEEVEMEGCDCTELCSMGPTCPGGYFAALTTGCHRAIPMPIEETTEVVDEDREALVEVLRSHRLHASMNHCLACRWRPVADAGSLADQHVNHVATILTGHLAALTANAKAEVDDLRARLAKVADEWQHDADGVDLHRGGFDGVVNLAHRGALLDAIDDLRTALANPDGDRHREVPGARSYWSSRCAVCDVTWPCALANPDAEREVGA